SFSISLSPHRYLLSFPTRRSSDLVLTFFSPSGYEIRKNNSIADITLYLPLDTVAHVRKFLDRVNPQMVFFIKYEFWPNYLYELRSEEHTSELQSRENLVCRLLREK